MHRQRDVVAGRIACSPLAPYTASKFALEALSEALAQEVKPFNIRVAVVQPGIIDTAMARRIEEAHTDAAYPQVRRFGHMFEASLEKPTPPAIVAEKIREIIESGTQKLRHPVGPDAEGFLGWRASLNDEEWIEWGALPDEAWYERVGKDFGLDARSKRGRPVAFWRRRSRSRLNLSAEVEAAKPRRSTLVAERRFVRCQGFLQPEWAERRSRPRTIEDKLVGCNARRREKLSLVEIAAVCGGGSHSERRR